MAASIRSSGITKECGPTAVRACPKTCAVMDSIPAVRSAMFTVLPPGDKLGRHHDPVASSLRYHLGLLTPNSDKCALTLDGVKPSCGGTAKNCCSIKPTCTAPSIETDIDLGHPVLRCREDPALRAGQTTCGGRQLRHGCQIYRRGHDDGKLSWISWAYKPIYKVRSYVKENIKPRSLLAYNIIKYGSIVLVLVLLYQAFSLLGRLF